MIENEGKKMLDWLKKDKTNQVELTVSNKTVVRVVAVVFLSLLLLAAMGKAAYALSLLFIAFFLTLALNGPVSWIVHRMPGKLQGNRAFGTGVSFLLVVAVLGFFLASIVPPLVRQTGNFVQAVPDIVQDIRSEDSGLGKFVRRNNLESQVDSLSDELSGRLDNIGGTAVNTLSRIGGSIIATLTVLVLTFMMLVEGPVWMKLFRDLVPKERRNHVDSLVSDMYRVVRGYVNGQVLLAATAAILILVPLFLLDISYPVALMVIVFICGLIPMIGHYIGATIVTLVALFTSPIAALVVLGYYVLYQQIENYVIQPTVQANTTNMSPLLVFGSLIIGVSLGGLLGGLVAIPVAGCLRILVLDYLKSRNYLEGKALKEYEKATSE